MSHLIDRQSSGVYIIAATPFAEDGALDLPSIDSLVEFYIGHGVSGITVLGMMGEAPKLSDIESLDVMRHFLRRVDGRVPVVVGVSGAGLGNLATLSKAAMDQGAAGVMVAPGPAQRTERQIAGYFGQVCAALGPDVPVCYQDYPLTTGAPISAEAFVDLAAAHPQIVMLKHEEWPGLTKLSRVRDLAATALPEGLSILVGNGGLYLPQELARGADGAMTGFAYPEMLVKVVDLRRRGQVDAAEDLFDAYLPVVRHEQQPGFGLALRKETLRRRGAIRCAATRAPGPTLDRRDHAELDRLLARLDARLKEMT
jgi:4-hydroxy-tetrahydrodipicolinate synthase